MQSAWQISSDDGKTWEWLRDQPAQQAAMRAGTAHTEHAALLPTEMGLLLPDGRRALPNGRLISSSEGRGTRIEPRWIFEVSVRRICRKPAWILAIPADFGPEGRMSP